MKQNLFKLMMLVGLIVLANTTFGQDKMAPYADGSYTYNLSYTLYSTGSVTLTLSSTDMELGTTTNPVIVASGTAVTGITAGAYAMTIPIHYKSTATGPYSMTVVVTEAAGCSNTIRLDVTIATPPSISIALSAPANITCQNKNGSPLSNQDASVGAAANTYTYTVTPTIVAGGTPNYQFKIGLASYAFGSATIQYATGTGTRSTDLAISSGTIDVTNATGTFTFTVSFTTTEGAGTTLTTDVTAVQLNLEAGYGIATVAGTSQTDAVSVAALPTIGVFN